MSKITSVKRKEFASALKNDLLVFDGAIGTQLYEQGAYFNRSFDELCITNPAMVTSVHRSYLEIGVDVIQTNTYGANELVLHQFGLEQKTEEICHAATTLAKNVCLGNAFVAGSVGPCGYLPKDLIGAKTRSKAFRSFRKVAESLTRAGCDLLVFETFRYLGELELAIEASYGLDIPIVAQLSYDEQAKTGDGAEAAEASERLCDLDVFALGANCLLGPEKIQDIAIELLKSNKPVVIQPNVGYPKQIEGRTVYQSSPETFGVCARRAYKLGVKGFGGCCGTSPQYLRKVVSAARMLRKNNRAETVFYQKKSYRKKRSVADLKKRSQFAKMLYEGQFVSSIEVSPPNGVVLDHALKRLLQIEKSGVSFVNVPDGPRATVRMSNLAFCKLVQEKTSLETIIHICGRDRNLLALQGLFLGAHALGVRNSVVVTGDPPKVGDYPEATAVFDLDSPGMLTMADRLNNGFDPALKPIQGNTEFFLISGAEPHATNFEREIERLYEKKEAGAEAVMTQPVYDSDVFDRFLSAVKNIGLFVIMGVLPLASYRNAKFLHENVPGMQVPGDILEKMKRTKSVEEARETGINIACDNLKAMDGRISGAYLMPPLGRVSAAIEVLKRANKLQPKKNSLPLTDGTCAS